MNDPRMDFVQLRLSMSDLRTGFVLQLRVAMSDLKTGFVRSSACVWATSEWVVCCASAWVARSVKPTQSVADAVSFLIATERDPPLEPDRQRERKHVRR